MTGSSLEGLLAAAKQIGKWSITPSKSALINIAAGAIPGYLASERSPWGGGLGTAASLFLAPRFGPAAAMLGGYGSGLVVRKVRDWKRRRDQEKALRKMLAMQMMRRQMMYGP